MKMRTKRNMDPLTVVLKHLGLKGQASEIVVLKDGKLRLDGKIYSQDTASILRTYRFEGDSDPGDASIIYVVQAGDGSIGYCMDGYGMYASHTNDLQGNFIRRASIETSYRP